MNFFGNDDDPIEAALRARDDAHTRAEREKKRVADEIKQHKERELQSQKNFPEARGELNDAVAEVNTRLKSKGATDTFRVDWQPNPGAGNVGLAYVQHLHPNSVGQLSRTTVAFCANGVVEHQYASGNLTTKLNIVEADFFGMNWTALLGAIIVKDIDRTNAHRTA